MSSLLCLGQKLWSPMNARVHPFITASHEKKCGQKKAACGQACEQSVSPENRVLASAHESVPYTSLLVEMGHHSQFQYENKVPLTKFAIHKRKSGLLAPCRLGRDWFKFMKPSIVNNSTSCATILACPGCVELMQATMLDHLRVGHSKQSACGDPAQPERQKWERKKRNGTPRRHHWTSGKPAHPELFQTATALGSTGCLQRLVFGLKRSALLSMVTCIPPTSLPLSHAGFRQPLYRVATVCPLDFFLIQRNGRQIPDVIELC